jgi:ketosteroid isomerase-like protein
MTTESKQSTDTVFARHLNGFMTKDQAALVADYADDAVIFTAQGPVQGKAAIEALFADVILPMANEDFMRNMKVVRQDIVGDAVYLLWAVEGMVSMGLDTFIIRDGKIVYQSFGMAPWA